MNRRERERERHDMAVDVAQSGDMAVDVAKSTVETSLRMELDLVWIVGGCKVNGSVVEDFFGLGP